MLNDFIIKKLFDVIVWKLYVIICKLCDMLISKLFIMISLKLFNIIIWKLYVLIIFKKNRYDNSKIICIFYILIIWFDYLEIIGMII